MLCKCKLVLVTSLAVGVFCPVTSSYNLYGANELTMANIPTKPCHEEELQLAFKAFRTCVMKTEIYSDATEEAQYTGGPSSDVAIKKTCAKSPQLKECARDLIKDVAQCLPPEEVPIIENTMSRLLDFLCHNGGARIISYINHMHSCNQETVMSYMSCVHELQPHLDRIQSDGVAGILMVLKEKCSIVNNGMSCITNGMKTCASNIPAELSQELHNLLLDSMACSGVSIILQNGVLRLMLAIVFLHLLIGKFNYKC